MYHAHLLSSIHIKAIERNVKANLRQLKEFLRSFVEEEVPRKHTPKRMLLMLARWQNDLKEDILLMKNPFESSGDLGFNQLVFWAVLLPSLSTHQRRSCALGGLILFMSIPAPYQFWKLNLVALWITPCSSRSGWLPEKHKKSKTIQQPWGTIREKNQTGKKEGKTRHFINHPKTSINHEKDHI